MPTGYTAAIADGITFEQFAMSCARAFGALINMRDEPSGAEIPERFEPSDYNLKQIASHRARLAELEAMTPDQTTAAAEQDYQGRLAAYRDKIKRIERLRGQYQVMLDKAQQWVPPSADHSELRQFMISQIAESISFDCDPTYYPCPAPVEPGNWHRLAVDAELKSIEYHEKQHQDEVKRTEDRNEWLRLLRESLKKFHH